jgi:DNA integrity scanning protein DisA with diadenylate cyclase activity
MEILYESSWGVEMNLSRMSVIKWLLEKLLTSFVTAVIVYFAPMIGLNFQKIGFGYVYTIITVTTFGISIVVYFLVPREKKSLISSD